MATSCRRLAAQRNCIRDYCAAEGLPEHKIHAWRKTRARSPLPPPRSRRLMSSKTKRRRRRHRIIPAKCSLPTAGRRASEGTFTPRSCAGCWLSWRSGHAEPVVVGPPLAGHATGGHAPLGRAALGWIGRLYEIEDASKEMTAASVRRTGRNTPFYCWRQSNYGCATNVPSPYLRA